MTTLIAVAPALPDAPELVTDLSWAGMQVLDRCQCADLVRSAVRHAPDVVVVWDPHPGTDDQAPLFAAVRLLNEIQPTPVLAFTSEVAAEAMEASIRAGIQSWVVNGFSRDRLRPLIQYTLARARHARALETELRDLRQRYEERRLVDRAKGILMSARHVDEDEAFKLLRSASMQAKLRIGQMSQQIIDAAQYGDAINRAGRLRMLSQRIVKLYALAVAGVEVASSRALLADSMSQVQQILQHLERQLSRPSFGDLVDDVRGAWDRTERLLGRPAARAQVAAIDDEAETLLGAAERLTNALEGSGLATTLRVINVSGRQRMYAQRLAKQALLEAPTDAMRSTLDAFDTGLSYLQTLPLSSPSIRQGLSGAEHAWCQLRDAAVQKPSAGASVALAAASEELLSVFDQLTGDYERSMQLLMG